MDTPTRLSPLTIALHWSVAFLMIGLLGLGFYMSRTETWPLYGLHKSLGVLALILIVARVAWRLKNGLPPPVKPMVPWEHRLAQLAHWLLLVGTLAMPLTGMMHSGAGGHGISVFGWTLVPGQHKPDNPAQAIPYNAAVAEFGEEAHEVLGYLMVALIALHIAAALKHHLIDKDDTLLRMKGKARH